MKYWLHNFLGFIRSHKIASSIVGVVIVLILSAVFFILSGNPMFALGNSLPKLEVKLDSTPPPPPKKYYSPLTGVEVADEAATKKQVRAIMIENSQFSRPQSGLKDAGVVFEAVAEGGITRLVCLYQESRPGLIGPVRSLRLYYVDWLAAFDATVSHVGGSAEALKEIRNGTYKDIDQFFNSQAYWRATDRYAPHNVYTNSDKLDALNNSKGYTSSNFTGFPRKDEAPAATPTASKISIPISYGLFDVRYDYDKTTNSYVRFLGDEPHLDREAGQIQPKVVIAIKVPMRRVLQDGYREEMQTIGSGSAYIFQDGIVTEGKWSKSDSRSQITFTDAQGQPVPLNPGQTWISATVPDNSVTWQ